MQDLIKRKKEEKIFNITEWTTQTPDLFPIELAWDILNRRMKNPHQRAPYNLKEMNGKI